MKLYIAIILLSTICISICSEDLYSQQGDNWTGLCKAGKFQSPINIIEGLNTKRSTSTTTFNYVVPKGQSPKFYYDGDKVYVEVDLGKIHHINDAGANEYYKAYKIEIHVPSEHFITKLGQTPRSAVEIQIYHKLISSDLPEITNQVLQVRRSIVSILLDIEGEMPDLFLEAMGVSEYNKNEKNDFNTAYKNAFIGYNRILPGVFDAGLTSEAFQGLLNLINADPGMYFYYGSESQPPCKEDVFWQVFSNPRAISENQFKFLYNQLVKKTDGTKVDENVISKADIYGNKRNAQFYNPNKRKFIKFSPMGSLGTTKKSS